jgi:nitroimidazol reductase NimA-like FMN-containing flavoprotein (pyridoxamine 5'-phosphate oxidase superfamily)
VVGRLAVSVDGSPDIFPVNHVVDHGSIVFRTTAGTKLAATKDRDVAFEADGYDVGTARAWSVVVRGRAQEIWDVDEVLRALRLPVFPWQPGHKPRFVRLEPNSVTGRRFVVEGGFTSTQPDQNASNEHHDHHTNA